MGRKAFIFLSFLGVLMVIWGLCIKLFFQVSLDVKPILSGNQRGSLGFSGNDTYSELARRISDDEYQSAVKKGTDLYCLMGMSLDQATAHNNDISLESTLQEDYMELEGWVDFSDDNAPYFGTYLDAAFNDLGITKDVYLSNKINSQQGIIYNDLTDFEGDETGLPTQAMFMNDFIVDSGVIIADKNKNVNYAMKEQYGTSWRDLGFVVTHIQQWSDGVFMQWLDACKWKGGNVQNVNYIFRSWITNVETQEILFRALKSAYGGSPTIGTWSSRLSLTEAENPSEFRAVLGSPNGLGNAYFLLTHKDKLSVKTINKIDIFVPNVPYTVTGTTGGGLASSAKIMLLFYVTSV